MEQRLYDKLHLARLGGAVIATGILVASLGLLASNNSNNNANCVKFSGYAQELGKYEIMVGYDKSVVDVYIVPDTLGYKREVSELEGC